ncbi:MAG: LexA family protein, partial [Paracoccus sp. (in: a-proteobacteria)]
LSNLTFAGMPRRFQLFTRLAPPGVSSPKRLATAVSPPWALMISESFIATLNAMFSPSVNTACKLFVENRQMHPSMARLYQAIKAISGKEGPTEAASFLGLAGPQLVHNWEKRGVSRDGLLAAHRKGINPLWLTDDVGEMLGSPAPGRGTEASNVRHAAIGSRAIPVISSIQAGGPREVVDSFQPGDGHEFIYTDQIVSGSAFALEIEGLSMTPEFQPGDRVIIDPEVQPQPGDFVAARNGSDEATFKKYRPRGTDDAGNTIFELTPLNDDYPTTRSDREPLLVVGTMVEHRKYRRRR